MAEYLQLSAYARFLLTNRLDELVMTNLQKVKELNLPLLAMFSDLDEAALLTYSRQSLTELLQSLATGNPLADQRQNMAKWKNNQIPGISHKKINVWDVVLSPQTRKYALLKQLRHYTTDLDVYEQVIAEIDGFYTQLIGHSIQTYVEIQQEDLQQERDFFQTVIDHTEDGISAYNQDFKVTLWNRALENRTGIRREQIVGHYFYELFPAYRHTEDELAMQSALAGHARQLRGMPLHPGGGYYDADLLPLKNPIGEVIGLLSFSRNVTEQRQAIDQLQLSETRLKEAQAMAHLGHWELDIATDQMTGSEVFYRIFGINEKQPVYLKDFLPLHQPEELDELSAKVNRAIVNGEPYAHEHRITLPDGSSKYIRSQGEPIRNGTGSITGLRGVSQDITEQKRAELALYQKNLELNTALEELRSAQESLMALNEQLEDRVHLRTEELKISGEKLRATLVQTIGLNNQLTERENFLSSIIDQTPISTWIADAEGTMIRVNQACLDLFGIEESSQVLGKYNFFRDESIQHLPIMDQMRAVFTEGKVAKFELDYDIRNVKHVSVPNGKSVLLVATMFPVRDHSGKVTNAVVQHENVTEQRKALQALFDSEARLQAIFNQTIVGIAQVDQQGNFTYVNERFCQIVGRQPEELLHQNKFDITHPDDRDYQIDMFRKMFTTGQWFTLEKRYIRPDGTQVWVHNNVSVIKGVNGRPDSAVAVCQDINTRRLAEEAVQKSEKQLRMITDALPVLISYVDRNERYQFINKGYEDLFQMSREQIRGRHIREILGEKPYQNLIPYLQKVLDGETLHFEVTQPYESGTRHLAVDYIPDHADGSVVGFYALVADITERKRKEEELLHKNAELQRVNNDMDNFIYAASHDLRAPIANLDGLIAMLYQRISGRLDEKEKKLLDLSRFSIAKLNRTINDLTEIAKVQKYSESDSEPLVFEEVFSDVLADLKNLLEEAPAELQFNWQVPTLYYARKNLRSILYNLLTNALKYRSPDRTPRIVIRTYHEGAYTVLSVSDNGLGISASQLPRLFTMFKRFHNHVEGSGIGLYMIKRIVENNGGRIEVESTEGEGTQFTISFLNEVISPKIEKEAQI
jgi:PAS domain S-box-containing protein